MQNIVLTTHTNPDGDALGSEFAFHHMLRAMGIHCRIINVDVMPENLSLLGGTDLFETWDPDLHHNVFRIADGIVALDFNQSGRMLGMADTVCSSSATRLVIDHHLDPRAFADLYLSVPDASSTAEIVYDILLAAGIELTHEIALGLYVGLMTDTGSFRFDRTTPKVHRIAAELLVAGVEPTTTHRAIFDNFLMGRTRLLGRILGGIEEFCEGRATVLSVTKQMFDETGTGIEDVENIVNSGLSIRGVEVTALITEFPDGHKISFRSRGQYSVNTIAGEFNGGGHRLAAGAHIHGGDLDEVKDRIVAAFCRLLNTE
jgi:phosphoesterase RecJ-like protein